MWRETQAALLREETEALLIPISGNAELHEVVEQALRSSLGQPDEIARQKRLWPLLPLMVCEAVSGRYEPALPAAAAVQLFKAAAEVFDDIEDADSSESMAARYGLAAAANAASALLILAEKGLARLKGRGVPETTIVRIVEEANSYYATACAGQHLDISLPPGSLVPEESYLRIAAMKSGAQMECACCVGARLGSAEEELVSAFCEFGRNLGIAAQITNDIRGITAGTDIIERKMTLPVIYALEQADGEALEQMEDVFLKRVRPPPDLAQIREVLFDTGAIHYATVKMELYKQLALDALAEAGKAGAEVARLKAFVEEKP